jgi:hypothetical protein
MTDKTALIEAAHEIATLYPVFPTTKNKLPCWSNSDLGVAKGHGGFKIATQDLDRIDELFSHPNAETVSVPMGPMSGLLCIDPDLYKGDHVVEWHEANKHWLEKTLCHQTQSGGLHYIFKWTDDIKFPATLAEGVDVKGHGGYIVFPPSGGYTVLNDNPVIDVPAEELKKALVAKGGTGNVRLSSSFNEATDDELIVRIQDATDLYPALRTLSCRLPSRRQNNGYRLTESEMVNILENLMDTSVAAEPSHPRHDDWCDRRSKIETLVETATTKEREGITLTLDEIEMMTQGETFIGTQNMIAQASRPVGPQRETDADDIERLISSVSNLSGEINVVNAGLLHETIIEPIVWIVPGMIPKGGTTSLAGMSNVGKTRWLASLVAALSVGDTKRIGLPQVEAKAVSLWIANEEHVEDIHRRIKAVFRQNNDKLSGNIAVRGKGNGMLRLVALNEVGSPELDQSNIANIVMWIREAEATFLIFDPYVTLSDAMDENSATSAAMLTKAFLLISSMTGCAILHAHHTPKDRAKDNDWVRGDSSAWRGSGAIYSALDCGFTLSHWMPKNGEKRKNWKKAYLEQGLHRWIVLDTGKIREGESLDPVVMELVGQEMDEGEGRDIGVCRLATQAEAENSLLHTNADVIAASELATEIIQGFGSGCYLLSVVHTKVKGKWDWPDNKALKGTSLFKVTSMFKEPINGLGGDVQIIETKKKTTGRWQVIVRDELATS